MDSNHSSVIRGVSATERLCDPCCLLSDQAAVQKHAALPLLPFTNGVPLRQLVVSQHTQETIHEEGFL